MASRTNQKERVDSALSSLTPWKCKRVCNSNSATDVESTLLDTILYYTSHRKWNRTLFKTFVPCFEKIPVEVSANSLLIYLVQFFEIGAILYKIYSRFADYSTCCRPEKPTSTYLTSNSKKKNYSIFIKIFRVLV